jgi:hypothetical protein
MSRRLETLTTTSHKKGASHLVKREIKKKKGLIYNKKGHLTSILVPKITFKMTNLIFAFF